MARIPDRPTLFLIREPTAKDTQVRYLPPLCPVLKRGSVAPGIPMQPMIHYLFLDLDALLSTIKTHLLAQPTVFPQELTRMSADGVLMRAERLTELLDGQRLQQPALVICRSGSYFNGSLENASALQTAGWNLKKKGALDHCTLENLMEKNLELVGASRQSGGAPKKMVLATGELRPPTQSCVQAYLGSGWRVKLFCLQRCWSQTLDELGRMHPGCFEVEYLDQHLRELLASNSLTAETASARARGASLLSQLATDGALWSRANVRRGSSHSVPHARALALATASPGPPSSFRHKNSSEVRSEENDPVCKQERDAAKRRQSRLATLPNVYSMENRERYVFLNLDNIAGVLFTSHTLYRRIDGAGSPQDVRLDFRALTQHLCGESESAAVKCQVAAYCKSSPYLARALAGIGWTLKAPMTPGSSDNGLHVEMMSKLVDGANTASEKTLVLAMGDGGLGGTKTNAYRTIIGKFLEQRWHVEIHAWLHALNDGLIDLQAQYPGRVVVKPLDEFISNLVYPKNQERAKAFGALNTSLNQDRPLVTPSGVNVPGGSSLERSVTNYTAGTSVSTAIPNVSDLGLLPPSPPLQSTVTALQQQIQQMQAAFSELQASVSTEQQLRQENDELLKGMREQASAFEEERTRQAASEAQQAHDAWLARRLQLKDREESLICPITCDLYKEPVTTVCCGKTFSAEVVKRLKECPWCRTSNLATHPNRDVASLVEQYCMERDELDAEEDDILPQ